MFIRPAESCLQLSLENAEHQLAQLTASHSSASADSDRRWVNASSVF